MSGKVRKRPGGSFYVGNLPEGCVLCAKGAKMVLLVTGKCLLNCFYCPLSEKKMGRDVVYADEMPVYSDEDILMEARAIDALGTGITGGEPLLVYRRTLHYIDLLKTSFGEDHHIHMYTTSGNLSAYKELEEYGLDEIRIHPPPESWKRIENTIYGKRIQWAARTDMSVGVEIPAIPNYKQDIINLINFASRVGVDFVNLNELEFSDTNADNMLDRGFQLKSDESSAVLGSEKMSLEILKNIDLPITLHYCSSSFKDAVQMRNRIKRRARNIRKEYEVVTEDGTLILGVIYGENLNSIYEEILKRFSIPKKLISINEERSRIEIAPWILRRIARKIKYDAYEVEEYPTWDRLEIEKIKLN